MTCLSNGLFTQPDSDFDYDLNSKKLQMDVNENQKNFCEVLNWNQSESPCMKMPEL